MMLRIVTMIVAVILSGSQGTREEVRHFPSIIYGQILLGPGASRYETIFTVTSKREVPASLDLFTDKGEPMMASFVDSEGTVTTTDSTFRFLLAAGQPVTIKVQLPPRDLSEDVALKTGWANFRSVEDLDAWALVRILKPDGTLVSRHVLVSEKPGHS
jgi:hypothetical protein